MQTTKKPRGDHAGCHVVETLFPARRVQIPQQIIIFIIRDVYFYRTCNNRCSPEGRRKGVVRTGAGQNLASDGAAGCC